MEQPKYPGKLYETMILNTLTAEDNDPWETEREQSEPYNYLRFPLCESCQTIEYEQSIQVESRRLTELSR